MYKTLTLTEDEMRKCTEFSNKSAETQQAIEFGQKDTKAIKIINSKRHRI